MKSTDLRTFWSLSKKRLNSVEDYLDFQRFQASLIVDYLHSESVDLQGRRLLDLGSGFGGYAQEFDLHGARVTALDLMAARMPNPSPEKIDYVEGDSMRIPFASHKFDIVFCASLIEHVPEPESLLSEIQRVLQSSGYAYISFPPFLSPRGGHECSPFHYFGERLALRISRRERTTPDWVKEIYHANEDPESYADLYAGCGLNKLSIHRFRKLLTDTQLSLVSMGARHLPLSFARWPLLGEFLTWHAQFLLRKNT